MDTETYLTCCSTYGEMSVLQNPATVFMKEECMMDKVYGVVIEYEYSYRFLPLCNVTNIKADKSGKRFEVVTVDDGESVHPAGRIEIMDIRDFMRRVQQHGEEQAEAAEG